MSISATLPLEQCSRRSWHIIVVGAGPAGSLAARELARRGADVLLVDKATFPRWKVCGCCLNGRALRTLADVGLGELVKRLGGVATEGVQLGAAGKQALVRLPAEHVLSRLTLDAALVEEAIRAGTHFLPATLARLGEHRSDAKELILQQGRLSVTVTAPLVLATDGLGCRLLPGDAEHRFTVLPGSRLGAGVMTESFSDSYRSPRIFMACGTGGYVGLVRVEDGRLNIAAALDPDVVKKAHGLGGAARAILDEAGFPCPPGIEDLPWQGTPLLTRHPVRPAADRIFLLGDAAGYVEPFTGEGIAWALACALAVVPLAYRGARQWDDALARRWTWMYRRMITRRQWVIRTLALVLRKPMLARALVTCLGRLPVLASPVVRYLEG